MRGNQRALGSTHHRRPGRRAPSPVKGGQIRGRCGFSALYFVEKMKTSGAYEIRLPEDFRSTHPSATTLHGSANLHFVIPSEAEGPAVRLDAKQRPSLLRHCTPGKLFRNEQTAWLGLASSPVGPLCDVQAHSRSLGFARDDKVEVCASMQCCRGWMDRTTARKLI